MDQQLWQDVFGNYDPNRGRFTAATTALFEHLIAFITDLPSTKDLRKSLRKGPSYRLIVYRDEN